MPPVWASPPPNWLRFRPPLCFGRGYLDAKNAFDQFDMNWTAYKNLARDGGAPLGAVPAVPALPAAPPAVDAGIFVWVAQLVARIKKHPGCTDAIAQDLGIIGAMQTFDPAR